MTFTDIKSIITDRLKIKSTDTDSITRIERLINLVYREVTAGLGMSPSRRSTITADTSIGSALVTFTGVEKIERIFDETSGTVIVLQEITYLEMREIVPAASDSVTRWAIKSRTDDTITVQFDVAFATVKQLDADVWAPAATLSGSDEPAFPPSFHDILVHGVLSQEYLRGEKPTLADREDVKYNRRMSQLRNWSAVTANQVLRQGQAEGGGIATSNGGGGSASSSYVTGAASSTDNAIARFDGASGKSIQNSGITIADGATGTLAGSNSGDVTLAGTPDYLTLAGQVITRALINLASHVTSRLPFANFIAATTGSVLAGRRSGSAGDFEEVTLGSGLTMTGTVLSSTAGDVVGPGSATDNAMARFDSATGKLIQNSAFVVDDTGHVTSFGGNVKFPGTQAASADVNTLDDYEEGTWTPTLSGSGGQSGQAYSAQVGTYTKIGRLVFVSGTLTMSTLGTVTGGAQIAGLPFTSAASRSQPVTFGRFDSLTQTVVWLGGFIGAGVTVISLFHRTGAATSGSTTGQAELSNTSTFIFSAVYEADN